MTWTFDDLGHTPRRHAEHWCREESGLRVHGTTRRVPREVFLAEEQATLLPAPTELFDVPLWVEGAKVHPDHHIQVARALYSVPTLYLHKKVRARADRTTVKIYFGTGLIKVHPRKGPGGRSTDATDYPADKAAYALRSVDALLAQSAVDRFKNAAYDFVMEGESYRPRLKPKVDPADPPPESPAPKAPMHPRTKAAQRRR